MGGVKEGGLLFSSPPPGLPHRSTERSSELTPKTHDEVNGEELTIGKCLSIKTREVNYSPFNANKLTYNN